MVVSSQKTEDPARQILLDGNRQTLWEDAKGEREAILAIDIKQPTLISTLLLISHGIPGKTEQNLVLQYKDGSAWKTVYENTTNGSGIPEF